MDLGLTGKRAIVAASSTGLGYAIAAALAEEGASVAICARDEERLVAAADRIRAETSAEVRERALDVTDPAALRAWIDDAASFWGGLDLAVPNAGGPPPGTFADTDPDAWDAAYRLTLRSALSFAHTVRPHLAPGGAMLFMTSISVRQPIRTLFLSTVFRAAVAAMAKALADEWAPEIRVNHLIPGRIATDRVAALDAEAAARRGTTVAAVRAANEEAIPLGRYGKSEEYAAAATFLLSDAASYITGASLQVDGGVLREIR